jgi:type I restriction enzyme S subunit
MKNRPLIELGELMPRDGRSSINPAAYPNETFDLLSIPAYDKGLPDAALGSEVGSIKQLVQPGDVLVSKIVPHIRRAWVVGAPINGRQIASSEWIVFRGQDADPRYLKHYFLSDGFHRQFMQTVSGVGGSLLRARPKYVAEIKAPLPPLEEQRRIAAILDKADRLLQLSRSSIAILHQTLEACFGDLSESISEGCVSKKLEEVVESIIDYRGKSPEKTTEGIPLVTARLIKEGRILDATEFIAPESYSEWMRRGMPKEGDVVFTTEAPLGQVAQIANPNVALAQRLVLLRGKPQELDNTYLRFALQMKSVSDQIRKRATGSTVMGIRQKELRQVEIPLPALVAQKDFARLALEIEGNIQCLRQREDFLTSLKRSLAIQLIKK